MAALGPTVSDPTSFDRNPRRYSGAMLRSLLLLLLLPAAVLAAEPADYAGKWTFDEASGDRAAVDQVVTDTAAHFPKLFRKLVRKKLEPGARILDVGCGPGRHAHELGRRGFVVHGVDISQTSSESLRPVDVRDQGRMCDFADPSRDIGGLQQQSLAVRS